MGLHDYYSYDQHAGQVRREPAKGSGEKKIIMEPTKVIRSGQMISSLVFKTMTEIYRKYNIEMSSNWFAFKFLNESNFGSKNCFFAT